MRVGNPNLTSSSNPNVQPQQDGQKPESVGASGQNKTVDGAGPSSPKSKNAGGAKVRNPNSGDRSRLRLTLKVGSSGLSQIAGKVKNLLSSSSKQSYNFSNSDSTSSSSSSSSSLSSTNSWGSSSSISNRSSLGSVGSDEVFYETLEDGDGNSSSGSVSSSSSSSSRSSAQGPELPARPSWMMSEDGSRPSSLISQRSFDSTGSDEVFYAEVGGGHQNPGPETPNRDSIYLDGDGGRSASPYGSGVHHEGPFLESEYIDFSHGGVKTTDQKSIPLPDGAFGGTKDPLGMMAGESAYITFGHDGVKATDIKFMTKPESTETPRSRLSSSSSESGVRFHKQVDTTGPFSPQSKEKAEEALVKYFGGDPGAPGPELIFKHQAGGGHSKVAAIGSSNLQLQTSLTKPEQKSYKFLSQLGSWLQNPNAAPGNAPGDLGALSFMEQSVLQSYGPLMQKVIPFPAGMGESGNDRAVVTLDPNKRPDANGGFTRVSGFDPMEITIGAITSSTHETKVNYPEKSGIVDAVRKNVARKVLTSVSSESTFTVKSTSGGIGNRLEAGRTSEELLQRRLDGLTAKQLQDLEIKMEGIKQFGVMAPVTFVGSIMQIALPNPGDQDTMPQVMLGRLGHPIFKSESGDGKPFSQHTYDKYKSNFLEGIDGITERVISAQLKY